MAKVISVVSATPVVSTSPAYTSGDSAGALLTFLNAIQSGSGLGRLRKVWVTDTSKQVANVDLTLFGSNPSASTFTDNGATAIPAADLARITSIVNITTHASFSATSVSYADGLDRSLVSTTKVADSGFTLYGALTVRATPTYATTSALIVYLEIEQEF